MSLTVSAKDWDAYIRRLAALNETAARKMRDFVQKHGFGDMNALIDCAYALATKYGEGAATLAAAMYDAVAELSGKLFDPAVPAETASYDQVAKTVQGVAKVSRNPEEMGSAVGRLVKQAGADTTLRNALRDGAEFAWVPSGDTCAFCITLASRGWQRASQKAVKGGHAEHIHSNCDCTYAIRFDSKGGVAGYDPEKYLRMYEGAEGDTSQEKINAMRRADYAEHKDEINAQKRAAYAERKEREEPVAASTAFLNKGDRLYQYSKNILPIAGFEDVVVHGDTIGFSFKDADENESAVTPLEFADILRKSGLYKGGNIRLISCEAGKNGAITAQWLANELGVQIMAPTELVYVYPDGRMIVSSDGLTEDGEWVIFKPERNLKEVSE